MLEYENQMFIEALQEDGLLISAKGLGLETVFINILKVYSDPGNLVIVLGTTDCDEQFFINRLKDMDVKLLPKRITGNNLSDDREITYLEGGVLFISGRIFVVDLLKKRVPLHLVTGILVWRAHGILRYYQEAFSLRLYRQHNKTGFIKAFSDSAIPFTNGFSEVERIMKSLFVKHLFLWPRFHSTVSSSLSNCEPEVIELHVKITDQMVRIQTSLLDLMNYIIKDLKQLNRSLELKELTLENTISMKFHKQLQCELNPIWHQLGERSKQLVVDLKVLGELLRQLNEETSVAFYASLNRLRSMEYAVKCSGWLLLDAAEDLFVHAKARVYNNKNELFPEPCPKWKALSQILDEIKETINEKGQPTENSKKVLILTYDGRICTQLRNYLTMGAGQYLLFEAMRNLKSDSGMKTSKKISEGAVKKTKVIEEQEEIPEQDNYVLTYIEHPPAATDGEEQLCSQFQDYSQITDGDLSKLETTEPIVLLQSVKRNGDRMAFQRTLREYMPSYVIMYGAQISTIRQLEVYQNSNPSISLTIYFVIYGGSVEEQEYLTSLKREKQAFEKLINTKQTMVVPTDQDGKIGNTLNTFTEKEEPSSRKGDGEMAPKVIPKVIVDIREFRSELPGLLHKRGIDIEPVTLIVGDYILTPEICVERKSISDLIMSLNSGRLYNQAVSMSRHYTKPMLLIEFDENKSFCLHGNYYVSKDMRSSDVTAKLQLLTLHFPKLKLVWSPNPQATAQLFEEIKQGKTEPDGHTASQIGLEEYVVDSKYNVKIQDFVTKLPGIHSTNLRVVLNHGVSLDNLLKLSQEELNKILNNSNDAQLLYNALHEKFKLKEATPTASKAAMKIKSRGLFTSKYKK